MAHAMQHPHDMGTMQRENSMTAMAFIMGAAIGAISGLLFAPKSGREIRSDIKNKSQEVNEMAHQKIDKAKTVAQDTMDKMRTKKDQVMDKAETARQHADEAMEDMAEQDRAHRSM